MSARTGGYTLLEMVVVIALLALATAMVAPASFRMIQSWRNADDVQRVLSELAAISVAARTDGRDWLLAPGEEEETLRKVVNLPEGWQLRLTTPLQVRANGACTSSDAWLRTGYQSIPLRVEAPFCRVRRREAAEVQ